jgi:hypothetical protein
MGGVVAAFGESEPCGHLAGPCGQLAAAGLLAYLVADCLAVSAGSRSPMSKCRQPSSSHSQPPVTSRSRCCRRVSRPLLRGAPPRLFILDTSWGMRRLISISGLQLAGAGGHYQGHADAPPSASDLAPRGRSLPTTCGARGCRHSGQAPGRDDPRSDPPSDPSVVDRSGARPWASLSLSSLRLRRLPRDERQHHHHGDLANDLHGMASGASR